METNNRKETAKRGQELGPPWTKEEGGRNKKEDEGN